MIKMTDAGKETMTKRSTSNSQSTEGRTETREKGEGMREKKKEGRRKKEEKAISISEIPNTYPQMVREPSPPSL